MSKYRRLRERCVAEGVLAPEQLVEPAAAEWSQLALAHDSDYLERVREGRLSTQEQRRVGFPWSTEMVERSRRSVGGTLGAARAALAAAANGGGGVALNLAGGTHHAHAAHGEGFCVFNDAAVAIRVLQVAGDIDRALVLDCDVHQGNGTAAIFAADPTVFTFSIHGARNFPFRKARSSLDIGLPDGAGDDVVLAALELHLALVLDEFAPGLVIYLAGADPFYTDRFGLLAMTMAGLLARDEFVLGECRSRSIPIAIVMAGGYAKDTEDTVAIHLQTVSAAVGGG